MLSTVSSTDSREESVCSEVHLRFDWQEGRKNPTYEYGHAGVCFLLRCHLSPTLYIFSFAK